MPTPKKPKKAIVFFVIALVVAGVVAIGAISVTMIMIGNANNNASATAAAKKKAEEEAKQAKEELERLKKAPPVQTVQEVKYREIQAITDIPPGTVVKDNMIASVEIKQDQLTPGSLEDETDVVGKVTTVPLKNGETLTKSKIMDNEGGFFIKDGQRAITIQVDQVGGLNGAVQPGSFVDVIATFVVDEKEKLKMTKTILQDVQIIAVGSPQAQASGPPSGNSSGNPLANLGGGSTSSGSSGLGGGTKLPPGGAPISSVTLAVKPNQAEMLALANIEGKFHLTLRNDNDKDSVSVNGSNLDRLITGIPAQGSGRRLPSPPRTIRSGTRALPINFSDTPLGGLPYPTGPEPPSKSFTMTILKGSSPEEKTFALKE